jgi:hypothetical protein
MEILSKHLNRPSVYRVPGGPSIEAADLNRPSLSFSGPAQVLHKFHLVALGHFSHLASKRTIATLLVFAIDV